MMTHTACFTGHRILRRELIPKIEAALESVMETLIARGIIYYGCGGAIGFDAIAGTAVLKMKERYPQIRLIMVLPCENQDIKWNPADRENYRRLLDAADKRVYLQKDYDDQCMLRRNRHLVDNSVVCIAYLTNDRGGTAYTVRYAAKQGKETINLAESL
ncbi:MAG: SLOG family protein [Candidatus Izemoplasmatales bacterium]